MFRVSVKDFITAAATNDAKLVRAFIEQKATDTSNVNSSDARGSTALTASSANGHIEIVNLLLKVKGIDLDKAGLNGYNPLIWASYNNETEIVKILLLAGANCNVTDMWGNTPLYCAVKNGNPELVKALLERKDINFDAKHKDTQLTAIELARNLATKAESEAEKSKFDEIVKLIDAAIEVKTTLKSASI